MRIGGSLGIGVLALNSILCPHGAQSQVVSNESYGSSTVIVPGGSLDAPLNQRSRNDRGNIQLRNRVDNEPVSRDDNVLYPRAVVPPAAIGSPPVETGPDGDIQVITDTYRVTGTSYKDLWSSVQRGAMSNGEAIGIGDAKITFQPRAEFDQTEGGCGLENVAVDLTAVLTFPEWDRTDAGEPRAMEAFTRMLNYLRVHEQQHVMIARDFRDMMVEAIEALPPSESCEAMQNALRGVAEEIDAMHQERQREYDTSERMMSTELFGRDR